MAKKMKFSSQKFRQDEKNHHLLTNEHLAIFEGQTVIFEEGRWGEIPSVLVGEEEWHLYPVDEAWCEPMENYLF